MSINLDTIIYVISFMIAIVFHEYAHGYVAYKLGDPTAKMAGRLTLNPLAHVDPVGLLSMVLFRVGWAKGVPINSNNFSNRRVGTLLVSSAGIITNFIIAALCALIVKAARITNPTVIQFLISLSFVNVMLGVFNLLPLPPLDGSKILLSLFPEKVSYFVYKNEKYLYIILIILILTNSIGRIIIPVINFILGILYG